MFSDYIPAIDLGAAISTTVAKLAPEGIENELVMTNAYQNGDITYLEHMAYC